MLLIKFLNGFCYFYGVIHAAGVFHSVAAGSFPVGMVDCQGAISVKFFSCPAYPISTVILLLLLPFVATSLSLIGSDVADLPFLYNNYSEQLAGLRRRGSKNLLFYLYSLLLYYLHRFFLIKGHPIRPPNFNSLRGAFRSSMLLLLLMLWSSFVHLKRVLFLSRATLTFSEY